MRSGREGVVGLLEEIEMARTLVNGKLHAEGSKVWEILHITPVWI